jgi:hypothetical protein
VFFYFVIRGATEGSEPGIHNHDWGLWIPGLRQEADPGMTMNTLRGQKQFANLGHTDGAVAEQMA